MQEDKDKEKKLKKALDNIARELSKLYLKEMQEINKQEKQLKNKKNKQQSNQFKYFEKCR